MTNIRKFLTCTAAMALTLAVMPGDREGTNRSHGGRKCACRGRSTESAIEDQVRLDHFDGKPQLDGEQCRCVLW